MVSPRLGQMATFARLPHDADPTDVDVAFDDATTCRAGARVGLSAIREQSRLLQPYSMNVDVSPFDVLNLIDYGDVDVVPGSFVETAEKVEAAIAIFWRRGCAAGGGRRPLDGAAPIARRAPRSRAGALGALRFPLRLLGPARGPALHARHLAVVAAP